MGAQPDPQPHKSKYMQGAGSLAPKSGAQARIDVRIVPISPLPSFEAPLFSKSRHLIHSVAK